LWIIDRTVLTRLFRRAHQDLGPAQGGLTDRRQRARALADELERWHSVDIQHVHGVLYDWPTELRRWRRYDEALRAPACSATGGPFKLLSREGPMGVFSRSGTARHRDQDSPRHTRRCKGVASLCSFVRLYKSEHMQGRRRVQMSAPWLISYLYLDNTMASHVD
jgi:hypothetical protein